MKRRGICELVELHTEVLFGEDGISELVIVLADYRVSDWHANKMSVVYFFSLLALLLTTAV